MDRYRPVINYKKEEPPLMELSAYMQPYRDGEWVRFADVPVDTEGALRARYETTCRDNERLEGERDAARASFADTENARLALLADLRAAERKAARAEAERDTWRQHYDDLAARHAARGRDLEVVARERDAALADRPGRWVPIEEKLPGEGWRVEVARKWGSVCYPARFYQGVFFLDTPNVVPHPGQPLPEGWVAFWRGNLAVHPEPPGELTAIESANATIHALGMQCEADEKLLSEMQEHLAIVQDELADQRRVYGEACAALDALCAELAPRPGETLLVAAQRLRAEVRNLALDRDHAAASCRRATEVAGRGSALANDLRAEATHLGQRADAAEAELRTARAELAAEKARAESARAALRLAAHEMAARRDPLVVEEVRGMLEALLAAPPDAGWCYDMAAKPGPGRGVNVERGETIILLAPDAWRRVQAPSGKGGTVAS